MTKTTIQEKRPFNLRYIVRAPGGIHGDDMRMTHRTASCNYRYIMRENGFDEFGPTPDFAARRDLFDHGRCAPVAGHHKAYAGITIWEAADDAARARRPELATAMHAVGSLPRGGDRRSWRALVEAFGEDHLAAAGMVVDWGIHVAPDETSGAVTPPPLSLAYYEPCMAGGSQSWQAPEAVVVDQVAGRSPRRGLVCADRPVSGRLPQTCRLNLAARAATRP